MFARLFRRAEPFPPPAPEGTVYAVGDIHGRADLLADLLGRIRAEAAAEGRPAEVVFLGDYVDRGPASRGVLEAVAALGRDEVLRPVFLRGNHEAMLMGFLEDPVRASGWLRNGGAETLESYGIEPPEPEGDPDDLAAASAALREALGPGLGFLKATRLRHRSGNVLFVHAAADPSKPAEEQEPRALLWGHPEFSRRRRTDGLWVVHGHIIVAKPLAAEGRIAVDTGAWATGTLTAVRIGQGDVTFLSTDAPA